MEREDFTSRRMGKVGRGRRVCVLRVALTLGFRDWLT